ncbi:Protein kinase domain-containing protein [Fusarium falciforme]|uniref:Protein kinase domain-containing protein n=1 Tax=Fusarium falciforme TaxID=195108 RepID=UPI002300C024|nr:Protein kinase domain-containing protein [Fusarium falciforme]WAO96782.1 Protein kinase domain-containing protein [Fusarium falciforme]
MPKYNLDHFYPVHLSEVFNGRLQTVAKLGYGSSSTIWLARDLEDHQYVALKVYIHNSVEHRELPFYEHLNTVLPTSKHVGADNVRKLLASFEVSGPHGNHIVLALQVSQMSLRDMDTVFMKDRGFEEDFVKSALSKSFSKLLISFIQRLKSSTLSLDIHPGNLLLGLEDNSLFKKLEDNEFSNPVPRKELPGRNIYFSRLMKPKAWDLLEGRTLFSARKEDGSFSDGVHLSEFIAALGPPPAQLLNRHRERAREYWNEDCISVSLLSA